ncbi:hypothetical protein B5M09_010667 [Aphanomyces astaci]|uniref:Uncharacterized protein n=1 Tax=Aphanomyces astaci TaxID=112090 RepID=A0A425DF05_APHAT|nr:hypothetical protein B5M09_010667 [Aphanomyces astaci]
MVFPLLETARQQLTQSRATGTEISGSSFLDLMEYMRTVLLEDMAVLSQNDEFNGHPLFRHPILKTPEFVQFRVQLLSTIADTPTPASAILQRAMPLVAESLADIRKDTVHALLTPYRMSRQLYSVHQAWAEFKYGIPPARSIESMETLHGSKWRSSNTDT